jgi:hypothetical protein
MNRRAFLGFALAPFVALRVSSTEPIHWPPMDLADYTWAPVDWADVERQAAHYMEAVDRVVERGCYQ